MTEQEKNTRGDYSLNTRIICVGLVVLGFSTGKILLIIQCTGRTQALHKRSEKESLDIQQ